MSTMADIFISGGTGYLGRELIAHLLARGHGVRSIVRPGSEGKLPHGCPAISADALDAATFSGSIAPAETFIHLTGIPKPAPWKERQFRAIDLVSLDAAARSKSIRHFIYVSVAHPAPLRGAYIAVRRECEEYLAQHFAARTIMCPWYVLGPGHWWPYALKPFYALAALSGKHRESAERRGLVTLAEMTGALVRAVETPSESARLVDVPAIREYARAKRDSLLGCHP